MDDIENIMILIIDALRRDRVGVYSDLTRITPFINSLASKGVIVQNAFSVTNTTDSSLTSIFTGRYPSSHGLVSHGERVTAEEIRKASSKKFLQEIFKENGYATFAIDFLERWHKKGFIYYGYETKSAVLDVIRNTAKRLLPKTIRTILASIYLRGVVRRKKAAPYSAEEATSLALKFIKKLHKKRKLFMLIHYWDTHVPYNAPQELIDKFSWRYRGGIFDLSLAELLSGFKGPWGRRLIGMFGSETTVGRIMAMYDASARYVDLAVERLVEGLEKLGILDKTLIVITSDHGESLVEHGIYFDHHGLYDVSIRVPLILYGSMLPQGRTINSFVQHVDLFPTLLELVGIKSKLYIEGRSLNPLIMGEAEDKPYTLREFIYAEEAYTERKFAIRDERYKYIMAASPERALCRYCGIIHGGVEELYDLKKDPEEKHNIVEDEVDIAKELRNNLQAYIRNLVIGEKIYKLRNILSTGA